MASRAELETWWNELERLVRALGQVGPDEVCCEGLTVRQCGILRMLIAAEGARISDLAISVWLTPSAMTRAIERLEAEGMVRRVRGALGASSGFRRHVPAVLLLAGLSTLLVSSARPQTEVRLPRIEGTVILAFDVSGSMAATDIKPTRIDRRPSKNL